MSSFLRTAVFSAAALLSSAPAATAGEAVSWKACGEPLVRAEYAAAGLEVSTAALSDPAAALLPAARARIAALRASLAPLSAEEERLAARPGELPLPLVHRTRPERLKGIISSGALLSPREASLRGLNLGGFARESRASYIAVSGGSGRLTPAAMLAAQDRLEGSAGCIFATVGRPLGNQRYGGVALVLSEKALLPRALVGLTAARVDDGAEDIPSYSATVYPGPVFKEALGLHIVAASRKAGRSGTEVVRRLLAAAGPEEFYRALNDLGLGRCEAKIPGAVELGEIEKVYARPPDLAEIGSWKESAELAGRLEAFPPKKPVK